ncbi:MAG: hypothetical protein A2V66_06440 [Ignavibacteria bacterium RBG_13_36_8]|nr:MAG: hypothetical protein A2V66_06440 [Ignavibacteria bacterium RBG_13_36_8]
MNDLWDINLGQENAVELLTKIYKSNRIPHAFLFSGKEGVGKHYIALQFAKLLNSEKEFKLDYSVQSKISNLSEPYIKLVIPLPRGKGESTDDSDVEKLPQEVLEMIVSEIQKKALNPYYKIEVERASNIKISSIRNVKKIINFNYDDIKYRFILIEDAHLMSEEAQNALLKSLEEPPKGIIFILTTPFEDHLLPTIKSRCWPINFSPLSSEIIKYILMKYFKYDKNIAHNVSFFADGSVTEAVHLIESNFEITIEKIIDVLRFSLALRYNSAIRIFTELIQDQSIDFVKQIIQLIMCWFNDALKDRLNLEDLHFEIARDTLEKFNHKFRKADIPDLIIRLEHILKGIDRKVGLNIITTNVIFEISTIAMR